MVPYRKVRITKAILTNLKYKFIMKKTQMKAHLEYEQPQMTMILLNVEQGFGSSTQLDDMKEGNGEWAY